MLNWKIRYAKIISRNRELLDPDMSVLEIGSGAYGIAKYLKRPVTGIEPAPVTPKIEELKVQQGDALNLEFPDDHFDFVVCVDVLEHIPAQDRLPAIKEMLRVAKQRLILSCPVKQYGEVGEAQLAAWFDHRYGSRPDWLQEHLANGLPDIGELVQAIANLGRPFDVWGNEGMVQHFAGILLDHEFPLVPQLMAFHDNKSVFEPPIIGSEWDLFYSYAFSIDKKTSLPGSKGLQPKRAKAKPASQPLTCAVYAACHSRSLLPSCGRVTPLFTGAEAERAGSHELTDLLKKSPRLENARWSELSGIYKIWKEGPKSSVVGFCHYRRFFDFSGTNGAVSETKIRMGETPAVQSHFFDLDALSQCAGDVVIVPRPYEFRDTPFAQYGVAHTSNDLCRVISLVSHRAPALLPHLANLTGGHSIYAYNMFAMRWQLFDELCTLWFSVLREFEDQVPFGRTNSYQNRDISFLSERLFDAWIRYVAEREHLRIVEVPIYFVMP